MSATHRPQLPWTAGCRIVPPCDSALELSVVGLPDFVTLPETGRLTAGSTGAWHLDMGLAGMSVAEIDLTAHGFRWRPANAPAEMHLVCPEVGVLAGEAEPGNPPALCCAESEVHVDGDITFVELPEATISLRTAKRGNRLRYALLYDPTTRLDGRQVARRWHDEDLARWWNQVFLPYDAFWRRQAALGREEAGLLARHVRELMADLRPPAGPLSLPWAAARSKEGLGMRTDQLPSLVQCWLQIRPRTAMNLVKNVLGNQRTDGSVPSVLRPDNRHDIAPTPPPLLSQCALRTWQAEPNRDFYDFALPILHRYVRWAIRYFDPEDRALPHWQEPDEAFVPGTFDANLVSADLTTFLIGEIDALVEMGQAVAIGGGDVGDLLAYRRRLFETLVSFLWDEAAGAFRDRYIDGPHIARLTLAAAVPLRVAGLATDFRAPLLALLAPEKSFLGARGLRAWIPWEGDPEEPPVLAAHQIVMLDALDRCGAAEERERFRAALRAALVAPAPQAEPAQAPDQSPGGLAGDPADADALAVVLLAESPEGVLQTPELSALVRWAEEHRTIFTVTGVVLIAATFALIFLGTCARRLLTVQTMETTAGLARRYYVENRLAESEMLYEEIIDSGRYYPGLHFSHGNVLFRQERWEEAAESYRRELARDPQAAAAMHNLALALHRANRRDDAIATWQRVTNDFSVRMPPVAERAVTALELIGDTSTGAAQAISQDSGK